MALWKRVTHFGLMAVFGTALLGCDSEGMSAAGSNPAKEEDMDFPAVRGEPRPPIELVDEVEARLLAEDCVGDLGRWERLYSYGFDPRRRSVDSSVVAFMFRQAGVHGFRPRRMITEPLAWVNLDDRPYNLVRGRYIIRDRTLDVEYCGLTLAQPPSQR